MPLPLIPIAIILVGGGLGGVGFGADGVAKMTKAKSIERCSREQYEQALAHFADEQSWMDKQAAEYGRYQLQLQVDTLGAWVRWLEDNEQQVRRLRRDYIFGVEAAVPSIPDLKVQVVEAAGLLKGGVSATVAAVSAQQAALFGVRSLAVAGTGAAISGLSGAAAESATLAWLGGGAIAAGGGGVAAGTMMLTGIGIAPALLIGGITLSVQGEKALTQAHRYAAEVNVACATMDARIHLFHQLQRRIDELAAVLRELNDRALAALQQLRAVNFEADQHAELFQRVALLMRGIGEVLSTPLVNSDGELDDAFVTIMKRYS